MAQLLANATRKDVEAYFKDQYSGTDAVVEDRDIDNVMNAIESQRAWRKNLPIEEQLALADSPVITTPEKLDQDTVPAGVTVVDAGNQENKPADDNNQSLNQ
jgi:hypothetical protein